MCNQQDSSRPIGASPGAAVVVRSFSEEYVWLERQCPGCVVTRQRYTYAGTRPLDVLTVRLQNGEEREFFFDVSDSIETPVIPDRPCPYCGGPLRTPRAKQCRSCGSDWHNPSSVVVRRGSEPDASVGRRSSRSPVDRDQEGPQVTDPRASFEAEFAPRHVENVTVLRFPDRLRAAGVRLFRVGLEFLVADGHKGFVWDVGAYLRALENHPAYRDLTDDQREFLGTLFTAWTLGSRLGAFVVTLHGGEFVRLWAESGIIAYPPANFDSEEAALAHVRAVLNPSNNASGPTLD